MRVWGLGAVILLTVAVVGCGGNSAAVGVTVTGPGLAPVTILLNQSAVFAATVSGISTSTVYWQICLPAATTGTGTPPPITTKPTNCTAGQGPDAPTTVTNPLTGYGTITVNGVYTAPSSVPSPNTAVLVATSSVKQNSFGTFDIVISSGITVTIKPATATIGSGETFQFTSTVTGTPNTAVSWSLSSGSSVGTDIGTISPAGLYTAPGSFAGDVTITAQSAADSTQKATATVTVTAGGAATITSIDPGIAAQGSVQQDVYIVGSGFLNTQNVVVTAPGQPAAVAPTTFISATLLRASLSASQLGQAGAVGIQVQNQNGDLNVPGPFNLNVVAVRPAVVASSPDSVTQSNGNANVSLTGGFFSAAATTATFNGLGASQGIVTTINSSRQLSLLIPGADISTPGLYAIVVQNAGVATGQPFMSALNLAVTPTPALIPGAPSLGAIGVGAGPSAVAIDYRDGYAVIANTGAGTVSVVNLLTDAAVGSAIPVGNQPTGVAVDDLLSDPVAIVVNSADQTVSAIDLSTQSTATVNVSLSSAPLPPLPFSVGVNPLTHRAIVAYSSTNEATVLDVSDAGGTPSLSIVQQVGGGVSFFGTGPTPAVAIDPGLDWAVITPGGAASTNIVDLGVPQNPVEPRGRIPQVVTVLSLPATVQGVGINSETHQALLSDPAAGTLTTFSLLDDAVTSVSLPSNGGVLSETGFGAAAVNPLENIGIAVNSDSTAKIVDLENAIVLQTVNGLGSAQLAQAVAVDPASNQAVVVNQGDNTVSLVSLGPAANPLQIIEASPERAVGGLGAANLPLTIMGSGFVSGSQVFLDSTSIGATSVSANGREITATIPGSMLSAARRYVVQVQNPGGAVSNVTVLGVIQPVTVGNSPVGVAIDTDRDLAVATNSGDGTVSLVSLAPPAPESPESLGPVGLIGLPVLAGATPEGVATMPRLGLAVVANNGSNNATVVDVTGTNVPVTVGLCGAGCSGATGVAINQDTATAAVTNTNPGSPPNAGSVSFVTLPAGALSGNPEVDENPVAVAIDPYLDYAAVATASQNSSLDFIDMSTFASAGRASGSGFQNPTGIVFDPVNQVFLAANSLLDDVIIIDPLTQIPTFVSVGINPMSLDYNFQTSTLVTANSVSHTLSVLAYVCPQNAAAPACAGPQVRTVLGLGGTLTSAPVLGPNAVAIDPKLNLAVVVDPDNNRILLVPLP